MSLLVIRISLRVSLLCIYFLRGMFPTYDACVLTRRHHRHRHSQVQSARCQRLYSYPTIYGIHTHWMWTYRTSPTSHCIPTQARVSRGHDPSPGLAGIEWGSSRAYFTDADRP
ncbi:hypothetical protein GGS23DRAFT_278378 [Durotheca rogersii]|uniref:uncharacterized protein n=1 Tax=Durotheca rogersii TaxID=419775 RepID=UPI00222042F7|nr:uncharacterized protein GGS23DRAFT_278378 [Durotheca rogersii]KAI5866589.1 hypothetical protein GGS23DRAFT_278378 [Durotheca rogersii]